MLVNATACHIASFFIGIAEICYMSAPIGQCTYCCPRDDTVDIQYKLFTRSNPTQFQLIPPNDNAALRATDFNFANPTVIYLMGFSESTGGIGTTTVRNEYPVRTGRGQGEPSMMSGILQCYIGIHTNVNWLLLVTSRTHICLHCAFLAANDYNFIAVDWSRLIVFPWYITAVRNTRYMGRRLAEFVRYLDTVGVPVSTLHIVGFSLGAEAAGFAGKQLRSQRLIVGRITGLDPAYPGYGLTSNDGHLSKGDAAFVDVLHTNPVLGFPTAIGDVDFYANPGSFVQPGCWIHQVIKNGELPYIYGCSHVRAWRLYSESLTNPAGFPATYCRDWTSATRRCSFQTDGYMGIATSSTLAGKMYFLTNEKPPFARNGP